jgi:DNA-binding Xre family transcriptional regulator
MGTGEIIERLIQEIERAEKTAGVSRYQLSQRTGIPQSTLSRLINRERGSLKVETVEKLCRELGFALEMKPLGKSKGGRK